jgi:hypothetical protein
MESAMRMIPVTLGLAVMLAALPACDISIDVDFPNANAPLDQCDATFTLSTPAPDASTTVTARITTGAAAHTVVLRDGQAVYVGTQALAGPTLGEYRATVAPAGSYVIDAYEPSRGSSQTTVLAPAAFDITAPAAGAPASLSGFTLTWTAADPTQTVRVVLTQTLFGDEVDASFGPFADTGSLTFTPDQLRDFRQGAPLSIRLTKTTATQPVGGFRNGTATVTLSRTVLVNPAP